MNAGQCDGRPSISRCRDHSVGNLSPDLVKARPSMAASRRAWASLASPTCRQSFPPSPRLLFGRWRIVEMDVWDKDFLDLVETAHLTFKGAADGEIAFGALKGFLDVRYGTRDGSACAEFSWQGNDENDPASGRGWVVLGTAGRLVGHFYIHNGEASGFVCDRA